MGVENNEVRKEGDLPKTPKLRNEIKAMNTKSVSSVAALLGAAVALNLSAFAGPGPQDPPQTRKINKEKKVAVTTTYKEWKAPVAEKSTKQLRPIGSYAVAARGSVYGF
jgi:hypothetical protein